MYLLKLVRTPGISSHWAPELDDNDMDEEYLGNELLAMLKKLESNHGTNESDPVTEVLNSPFNRGL